MVDAPLTEATAQAHLYVDALRSFASPLTQLSPTVWCPRLGDAVRSPSRTGLFGAAWAHLAVHPQVAT